MVFDKPPVNAFNSAEWASIKKITDLGNDKTVHVIIIRAEGRGFCAGVDILGADPNMIVPVNKGNYDTLEAIHRNPKPVIVAPVWVRAGRGIGSQVRRILSLHRTAPPLVCLKSIVVPWAVGRICGSMFPVQKVRAMYFTGDFIDAQEAYRLGG